MLPLALFIPKNSNKKEAVLLLNEQGKNYAANNDSLAMQLIANGYTVLLGNLPGIGELGPGYLKGDAYIDKVSYNIWFSGILTGKSIVGIRAEDIIRMVHFIKSNFPDYYSISAISVGVLGSELLHAATFEKNIQKISMIQPFLSYSEIALTHDYSPSLILSTVAGAIEKYDLPDLMAGLYPRKLLIINPVSSNGSAADNLNAENNIRFPLEVYSVKDVPHNIKLVNKAEEQIVLDQLLLWLK